jgi:hypothetical protein
MIIKVDRFFSDIDENGEEKLYSYSEYMTEEQYLEELRQYTKWDDTDNLKKMKDSDILAEKKRSNAGNYAKVGVGTAAGAGIGLGAAKIAQNLGYLGGGKGALGLGAAAGGLIGAGSTYLANRNKIKDNKFYNQRLGYAQRQANRRERKDFVSNNTNREGYSY